MRRLSLFLVIFVIAQTPVTVFADAAPHYCNDFAKQLLNDKNINKPDSKVRSDFKFFLNSTGCFIQANLTNNAIAPARVSFWNGFVSLEGGQQQGSSLSSSGSTNAVSKPSGPTSMIEEFGGANVSSGTSSLTFQWAPGTLFTNLALSGIIPPCEPGILENKCVSPKLLKHLSPLTLKVTGNTSSGTPSLTGSATTSTNASSQQVAVSSKGVGGPSFSGLTVQYSFWGSKAKAAAQSLTTQTTPPTLDTQTLKKIGDELSAANGAVGALVNCDAYQNWKTTADKNLGDVLVQKASPTDIDIQNVENVIENQYRDLLTSMLKSKGCQPFLSALSDLLEKVLEANLALDNVAQQKASKNPEFAIEYDLNTPPNQPSFSSAKGTLTYSFSFHGTASKKVNTNDIQKFSQKQTARIVGAMSSGSPLTLQQTSADGKDVAQKNVDPWSLTVTGVGDFYNAGPDSSIPSASRLRDVQFGTELARLFSPSECSGALRQFIGDVTAAVAYSYEDQTSPAILTGPALSDFTGLPTSTTAAFAQRGVIHLEQLRLGFGSGTNVNFPIAFTYSNRTELITHPKWGLQFGISYNLTALFSSSGSSK